MRTTRLSLVCLLMIPIVAMPRAQAPAERIDLAMIAKIKDEGLNRSQVMDHISWLSDVYGPRLTGGPGIMQASDWALKKFGEWGLANAHRETFAFGKGWSLVRFSAHLIEPQVEPLIGFPGSWSSSTIGTSNMDTFDRVQAADMIQQATVAAVFAYNAAMRDAKLPRKPLPAATAR